MADPLHIVSTQFFHDGKPVSYGSVTIYKAGTTDKATLWSDPDESVEISNPVPLNSGGSAIIYINEQVDVLVYDRCGAQVDTIARATLAGAVTEASCDPLVWEGTPNVGNFEFLARNISSGIQCWRGLANPLGAVLNGALINYYTTGTSTAFEASLAVPPGDGQVYAITWHTPNTTANPTLTVTGLGALPIKDADGKNLAIGELTGTSLVEYDSDNDRFKVLDLGSSGAGTNGYSVMGPPKIYESASSYPKNPDAKYVHVMALGAGAGGWPGTGGTVGAGGSGGGEEWAFIDNDELDETTAITIGQAGAPGQNGGTTSFGAHISATGGQSPGGDNEYPGPAGQAFGGYAGIPGEWGGTADAASTGVAQAGDGASGNFGRGGKGRTSGADSNTYKDASGHGAGGAGAYLGSNAGAGSGGKVMIWELA